MLSSETIPGKKVEIRDKHLEVFQIHDQPGVVVIMARTPYIPHQNFQDVFNSVAEMFTDTPLKKVIFDKRSLIVFNQVSMEWYFTVWKELMFERGLAMHRKILPEDRIFVQSVRIARRKLDNDYPKAKYHLMDIRYLSSLEEAIDH